MEGGKLCERKNGRGVDTNRNWGVDWGVKEKDYDPSEEFPGRAPHRWGPWGGGALRLRDSRCAVSWRTAAAALHIKNARHPPTPSLLPKRSEPEVQVILAEAKALKPHVWLNVHSGMFALFTPYDHKPHVRAGGLCFCAWRGCGCAEGCARPQTPR